MIIGKVAQWMAELDKGQAVIISRDDIIDSAEAYRDSGFDHVRPEYIKNVVDEVNSEECQGFSLWERPDGRWTLER
jgi:hypothetical protein